MKRGMGIRQATMVLLIAATGAVPGSARAGIERRGAGGEATSASAHAAIEVSDGVTVRVGQGPDGLVVEGRCRANATNAAAWSVLTDYDGIDRFVSSMEESRVLDRDNGNVLVEQVAVGGRSFFRRRIETKLRVHEEPPGRIGFEDVSRRDFAIYRGEWRIVPQGTGVDILYRVEARPAFHVPGFLVHRMFENTVRSLLSEVRAEIERREALVRADNEQARAAISSEGPRVE